MAFILSCDHHWKDSAWDLRPLMCFLCSGTTTSHRLIQNQLSISSVSPHFFDVTSREVGGGLIMLKTLECDVNQPLCSVCVFWYEQATDSLHSAPHETCSALITFWSRLMALRSRFNCSGCFTPRGRINIHRIHSCSHTKSQSCNPEGPDSTPGHS